MSTKSTSIGCSKVEVADGHFVREMWMLDVQLIGYLGNTIF